MRLTRLVIAGLSGDSGKTIVSLSLLSALRQRGLSISVFKKGPDYIDAAWLSSVARSVCRNLDTHMVDRREVLGAFTAHAVESDISIIEGNRGIFDGMDSIGTHSTAGLARLLHAPVILVVNTARATRTISAIVKGAVSFDPEISIEGIILNRVTGDRHKKVIIESIEKYCGLPVLGAIPNFADDSDLVPNRHLGLIPPSEFEQNPRFQTRLGEIADKYIDVDGLVKIAERAEPLQIQKTKPSREISPRVRIGYFADDVFTFYYPENLEALKAAGADLIPVSSLNDANLPHIDALYIGGGFPETHAERLAGNRSTMESVRNAADTGLPIYAECGGLIYLSRSLIWNGNRYPMAGIFPIDLQIYPRPVGHGYTITHVDRSNPFFEVGTSIKGHEFHYSGMICMGQYEESCMKVEMGVGLGNRRDGLLYKNVLACYTHIHADGVKSWAPAFVSNALEYYNGCNQTKDDGSSILCDETVLKDENEPLRQA